MSHLFKQDLMIKWWTMSRAFLKSMCYNRKEPNRGGGGGGGGSGWGYGIFMGFDEITSGFSKG